MERKLAHLSDEQLTQLRDFLLKPNAPTGQMGAKRKELVERFGYDCYDDETTEFLTESGWKRFDDVQLNQLATVNIKTGSLEWQHPTSKIDKSYTGSMYCIEPNSSRTIVTPNHTMLVSLTHRNFKNNFSVIYDEKKSNWELLSLKSILKSSRSHYYILKAVKPRTEELFGITDAYLRLAGLFISEGSVNFRDGKVKAIRISQKKIGKVFDIANSLMKVFPLRRYEYEKETLWILSGETALKLYKDFGHGSKNEVLPSWCYHLSTRQVEILFDSMLARDGTHKTKNDVYYTSSVELANDIHAMLTSVGILASCKGPYSFRTSYGLCSMYQVIKTHVGKRIGCVNFHKLLKKDEVAQNKGGYPIKELDSVDRRVVCFEVPNGTLITKNGGNVAIQGNCKSASHLIRLLKMGIEALSMGEIIVERPDNNMLLEIKRGDWSLERVRSFVDSLFLTLDMALANSKLPDRVDMKRVNDLCVDLMGGFYGKFYVEEVE